jgi:Ca2+-binding RTX toxin-like protein
VIRLSSSGQAEATIAKLSSGMHLVPALDGKLVAFGSSEIVRLNADGTSDDSFGRVITNGYDNLQSTSMKVISVLPIAGGAALVIVTQNLFEPRLYRLQGDDAAAGSISVSDGVLSIAGTSDADAIDVQTRGTDLFVRVSNSFGRAFSDATVDTITLDAGAGDDTIWQRTSHDSTLVGGDGSDTIRAGDGADSVSGGSGSDLINGGIGNDALNGDGGKDSVYGSAGDDTIFGGASADRLYGGDGADRIEGQGGHDRISGGEGADTLHGGAGNDTFLTSADSAIDEIWGDRGFDTSVGDVDELLAGIEQIL